MGKKWASCSNEILLQKIQKTFFNLLQEQINGYLDLKKWKRNDARALWQHKNGEEISKKLVKWGKISRVGNGKDMGKEITKSWEKME